MLFQNYPVVGVVFLLFLPAHLDKLHPFLFDCVCVNYQTPPSVLGFGHLLRLAALSVFLFQ